MVWYGMVWYVCMHVIDEELVGWLVGWLVGIFLRCVDPTTPVPYCAGRLSDD